MNKLESMSELEDEGIVLLTESKYTLNSKKNNGKTACWPDDCLPDDPCIPCIPDNSSKPINGDDCLPNIADECPPYVGYCYPEDGDDCHPYSECSPILD